MFRFPSKATDIFSSPPLKTSQKQKATDLRQCFCYQPVPYPLSSSLKNKNGPSVQGAEVKFNKRDRTLKKNTRYVILNTVSKDFTFLVLLTSVYPIN